jgi:hypothetical protein
MRFSDIGRRGAKPLGHLRLMITIEMLMRIRKNGHLGTAEPPVSLQVTGTGMAIYAAVDRLFRRWGSRRLLTLLNSHELLHLHDTHSDLWRGLWERLPVTLDSSCPARDSGELIRHALAELRKDQLRNLGRVGPKESRRGSEA